MKKEKQSKPGYGKILDAWVPPENAGEPVGCVATSFTFSPALFEEECLGRFLRLESNAAEDGAAYLIEREEKLAQLSCAAALVDQHHARGVRSLRWDLLSARLPRGILHAKVSLLLWSNHARLIVGSANLTDDGYRRNHEVFSALDFFSGADAPLAVFDEFLGFLGDLTRFVPAPQRDRGSLARWHDLIGRAQADSRAWGATEPPRGFAKPRAFGLFTGPDRPSAFAALREKWPDASPPERAYVVSPFFDPPEAPNEPARQIWSVLKQRGTASVEYHVTAEEVPGENAVLVHAPESLIQTCPLNRSDVSAGVERLALEDSRPLHAKSIWLENDRLVLYMLGSSNFTSAGLGLGSVRNIEANLAFAVGEGSGAPKNALANAWLPGAEFPDDVELRWRPRPDDGEDSADGAVLLPASFAEANFGNDAKKGAYLEFTFVGQPPMGWALFPEEETSPFVTESDWRVHGCPASLTITWPRARPPSGFRVSWGDSGGFAWWAVNVLDGTALPPPDDLRDLPLEVLLELLTSAKPLHQALSRWLKRKTGMIASPTLALDPHKRVDTSAFLLQRTRRVSWAFSGLRQRLEKPVASEQSLAWRLRGPVGVRVFAQAIAKEARSDVERCFLLTELCLELKRVSPVEMPGSLSKTRIRSALREMIREIRVEIPAAALAGDPMMAAYSKNVFGEDTT